MRLFDRRGRGQKESFENLLKRFSRKVQPSGILSEMRRCEHFGRSSIKHKRKEAARKRKSAREAAR